jgi:hypothetical protein
MQDPKPQGAAVQSPDVGRGNREWSPPVTAFRAAPALDLRDEVVRAALELFASYGIQFFVVQPGANVTGLPVASPSVGLLGVCGFGGPTFTGHVILSASDGTLSRSNNTRSSRDDWMAELANQFLGRIKNQLLRSGIHVQRVPPVVIKGVAVSFAETPAGGASLALADGQDWVLIRLDSQPSTDDAPPTEELAADVMREGEMVLF